MITALRIIFAVCFLSAAAGKLTDGAFYVGQFREFGLSDKFRYGIARLEILGAVLLLIKPVAVYGCALLFVLMCGAVFHHLKAGHAPLRASAAVIFGAGLLWIAFSMIQSPVS